MQKSSRELLKRCLEDERSTLLENEAYELLNNEGIQVPKTILFPSSSTVSEASLSALSGDRIILKLASRVITHKTDVGGIRIVDKKPDEVSAAVRSIIATVSAQHGADAVEGVLAAEIIQFKSSFGHELLASFRLDDAFGPVINLGIGGIHTEFFHKHLNPLSSLRSCSAYSASIDQLITASALDRPLSGKLRGQSAAPVSREKLEQFLSTLARIAIESAEAAPDTPRLSELELNPLVVDTDGRLVALDALARVEKASALRTPRPLKKIKNLLRPKSALVIGASTKGMNSGRIILRNLIEGGGVSKDQIFCLHPKAEEIDGVSCYSSIDEINRRIDMAVVAIPASAGADRIVAELVEKRAVESITLIPGGFAETEGGKEREARLRHDLAESHNSPDGGVILNGGNCLGIVSNPGGYNTFFLPKYKLPFTPARGDNLASISQSGAYLVTQASTFDGVISPRYSISVGNQVDLTIGDYLAFLKDEKGLDIYSVYVEGFQPGDGQQFIRVSREIVSSGHAVLLYKAGRSPEGARAASSHTASMVGSYDTAKTLSEQAGVRVCDTLDEFQDLALAYSLLWSRGISDRRVGIVTNAGFEATAAADRLGFLTLADLSEQTLTELTETLPEDVIDAHNPLDVTPVTNTEGFVRCVEIMENDPGVDCIVISPVPPTPTLNNLPKAEGHRENVHAANSLASRLIHLFGKSKKPMVFCVDSGSLYDPMVTMLLKAGAPCYRHIDRAMNALSSFTADKHRMKM